MKEMGDAVETRPSKILVVDDNPANLSVLVDCLAEHGFEIVVGRDGETGLRLTQQQHPDLILLDVLLPGIDGFEVCRRLKADERTQEIPVLFMTIITRTEDKVRGFEAGGLDYITKPFEHQEVLARVTAHLRSRRLTRELEAAKENLERRVAERTAELARANAELARANAELTEEIAERKRAEKMARQLNRQLALRALHDDLTGLPNRALLLENLQAALVRARRSKTVVGVLFIDLDDFKSVNDSFGHVAADGFLVQVGRRIAGSLRGADTAARIGGDEFVVVCEGLADLGEAESVAQRIHSALSAGISIGESRIGAPASIGIAVGTPDSTPEGLLGDADTAMYQSKRSVGRRWEPAHSFGRATAIQVLTLEAELREAIRTHQLRVYYQPTIDLERTRMVGVEALLRWQHPARGLVLPQELIHVAERRNLIGAIGNWVLKTACRQAGDWVHQFGDAAPAVAVNVSSRQLGGQGLTQLVQQLLQDVGLPPEYLCLEITESQFVSVDSAAAADLLTLEGEGVGIAVDDFGTGFAGFDYLRRLPVTTIKIDKSYVQGLGTDRADTAITAGVIALARSLGLRTVAEGIETDDQRDRLHRLKCTDGQGWLWYPALPADRVEQLICSQQAEQWPLPTPDSLG
jgi:diguanylate cyclase (GGDEF)-like protein